MSSVSDIRLIRTDTTLDLSQKAEKRYLFSFPTNSLVARASQLVSMWALSPGNS